MDFAETKKALDDFTTELDTEVKAIKNSFARIATAQANLLAIEDKWTEADGTTLEQSINSIADENVRATYTGILTLLRAQKTPVDQFLVDLDTVVEANGLQLV